MKTKLSQLIRPVLTVMLLFQVGIGMAQYAHNYNFPKAEDVGFRLTEPATYDQVYYVSKSGADTNPGSQDKPFLSINKGVLASKTALSSGKKTKLILLPGVYTETITQDSWTNTTQKQTLFCIEGNTASGTVTLIPKNNSVWAMSFGGKHSLIIRNIHFNGNFSNGAPHPDYGLLRAGVQFNYVQERYQNWLVENCEFSHSNGIGTTFHHCEYSTFRNLSVHDNKNLGVHFTVRNCLLEDLNIHNNNIENLAGFGGGGLSWIGVNCYIRNSHLYQNNGAGFRMDHCSKNCVLDNILAEDNAGYGIFFETAEGPNLLKNSEMYRNDKGLVLATVYDFITDSCKIQNNVVAQVEFANMHRDDPAKCVEPVWYCMGANYDFNTTNIWWGNDVPLTSNQRVEFKNNIISSNVGANSRLYILYNTWLPDLDKDFLLNNYTGSGNVFYNPKNTLVFAKAVDTYVNLANWKIYTNDDATSVWSTDVPEPQPCQSTPYLAAVPVIPSVIQAEEFDLGGSGCAYHDIDMQNQGIDFRKDEWVDIATCSEGAYQVISDKYSEWLNYTIQIPVAGLYVFKARVAAEELKGGTLNATFMAGNISTGDLSINPTGGADLFETVQVKNLKLNAGTQVMKVKTKGVFGINFFEIIKDTVTNVYPECVLTSPVNQSKFVVQKDITLKATAKKTGGTISKVEFYHGETLIGEDLSSPYSIVWRPDTLGTYKLRARAIDNKGYKMFSEPVSIDVIEQPVNLLQNPGFESGKTIWQFDADYAVASTETHSGTQVLKLSGKGDWCNTFQAVDLSQNTDYTFSAWIKGTASVQMKAVDQGWGQIYGTIFKPTAAWKQYYINFNSGKNSRVIVALQDAGSGTSYIDDCQLLQGKDMILGTATRQLSAEPENELSIFPNPFADVNTLNIRLKNCRGYESKTVKIFDLNGRLILEQNVDFSNGNGQVKIERRLEKQIYIVQVGSSHAKLIVGSANW